MPPALKGTARQVHVSTHVDAFACSEKRGEFATRTAESAGRAVDSLFGPAARETLFLHLALARGISQWDIFEKPTMFMESLHGIFGEGAHTLEAAIVDEVRKEFGLELPVVGEKLVDVFNRALAATKV